jgi:hypothetical protein
MALSAYTGMPMGGGGGGQRGMSRQQNYYGQPLTNMDI